MATSPALGPASVIRLPEGTIRYHDTGSTGEDAQGPALVFVHGIVANADVWRHVVGNLSGRYRCIAPDWPFGGHELAMSPGTDFSLPGLADLVVRTLDALELRDVVLVGNDTGGAVCQMVAARHPTRLAGLVLTPCDAFGNFLPWPIRHLQVLGRTSAGLRVLAQLLRFRPVYELPLAFGLLTRRPIPREVMESYTGPLRSHRGTRTDLARLLRVVSTRFTRQAAEGLPSFSAPALVAWARQDFFPLAHGERLAGLLPAAELHVLDDSGPFVGEDQPNALAALVDDFLRRRVCEGVRPVADGGR